MASAGSVSPSAVEAQQLAQLTRSRADLQDQVQRLQDLVQRHHANLAQLSTDSEATHAELDDLREKVSQISRVCAAVKRSVQHVWQYTRPF